MDSPSAFRRLDEPGSKEGHCLYTFNQSINSNPSVDNYPSLPENQAPGTSVLLPHVATDGPSCSAWTREQKLKQLVRQRHNIYRLESCLRQYELERIEASQVVERINDLLAELNHTATEIFTAGDGIMDNLSLNESAEFEHCRRELLAHLKLKRFQLAAADANVNNFIDLLSQLDQPERAKVTGNQLLLPSMQKPEVWSPLPVSGVGHAPLDNCGTSLGRRVSALIGGVGATNLHLTEQGLQDVTFSRQASTLPRQISTPSRYGEVGERCPTPQLDRFGPRSSPDWYTLPSRLPIPQKSSQVYDRVAPGNLPVPLAVGSSDSAPHTPPPALPLRRSSMARSRAPVTPPRRTSLKAKVVSRILREEAFFAETGDQQHLPMSAEDAEVSQFMSKVKQTPNGWSNSSKSKPASARPRGQESTPVPDSPPPPPPYYVNLTFPEEDPQPIGRKWPAGDPRIVGHHFVPPQLSNATRGINLRIELENLGHPLNQLTVEGYGQLPSDVKLSKAVTGFQASLASLTYSRNCFSILSRIFKPTLVSRLLHLSRQREDSAADPIALLESKVLITASTCRGHLYLLHDRPQRSKPRAWSSLRERGHQRPSLPMLSPAGQEVPGSGSSSEANSPSPKTLKKMKWPMSSASPTGWLKHWFECSVEEKRLTWFPNTSENGGQTDHLPVDNQLEFISNSTGGTKMESLRGGTSEVGRPPSCDRWTQVEGREAEVSSGDTACLPTRSCSVRHCESVESLEMISLLAGDRIFGLKSQQRIVWLKAHSPELKALWMDVLQITQLMSLSESG